MPPPPSDATRTQISRFRRAAWPRLGRDTTRRPPIARAASSERITSSGGRVGLDFGRGREASSPPMRHPGGGNALTTRTTAPMDYQRIAEAFVHPIKLRILALMAGPPPARAPAEDLPEPGWSPHSLYVAVGEPLGNVSYHVRQLQKAGLIQLTATRQRRGALEHYY